MIGQFIVVALGGAVGAVLRWLGADWVARLSGRVWLADAVVNVIGCFAMGLLTAVLVEHVPGPWGRTALFAMIGVCGAFTAFSAFSLDTVMMIEHGRLGDAMAYAAGSVALALLAVFAGLRLGRILV